MGRKLRRQLPDQIYLVGNRTHQGLFLLRPDHECNRLIGKWLARSIQLFGIEVFAFVFMSNHYHILLRAPRNNLHEFMCYFQANLAKDINSLRGRQGHFWQRRYDADPVLDHEAAVTLLLYVLMNPVKACLVGSASEWPGLCSLPELANGAIRRFTWFDRTGWRRAGCPRDREGFTEEYTLRVRPLPGWRSLTSRKRRNLVVRLVREREKANRDKRRREGKTLLGRRQVREVSPFRSQPDPDSGPKPLCHASTVQLLREFEKLWEAYVLAFREAAELLKQGVACIKRVLFPKGSFPPRLPQSWPKPA